MFRKLPPLQALVAFESVARLHSFAKAAQELCVTPSAISHRLSILERYYGVRLFNRTSTDLALTRDGQFCLDAVLDALSTLQSISTRLCKTSGRSIRIHVAHSFASKWLVEKLDSFHQIYADTDLEIQAIQGRNLNELMDLRSGEVDIAIRYGKASEWHGFKGTKLMPVKLFPVCSREYLDKTGPITTAKDVLRATLLHSPRDPWLPWFKAAGLRLGAVPHGTMFNDVVLMLQAAMRGQGIALARNVLVSRDLAAGRLIRLLDVSLPSERAYYVLYFTRSVLLPEVEAFVKWLVRECKEETQII